MELTLKLVDFLARNGEGTMNALATSLDEYYSFVHRIINRLAKEGVIIKTKIGKAYLCSLNVRNEKALALLQLAEFERTKELYASNKELKVILEDFLKVAANKSIISVVLFGSQAKSRAIKQSDIDLLVLVKKSIAIEKVTNEIFAKYGKEINPIQMTETECKKQKRTPLIAEIQKNHVILFGVEPYLRMVFKE